MKAVNDNAKGKANIKENKNNRNKTIKNRFFDYISKIGKWTAKLIKK